MNSTSIEAEKCLASEIREAGRAKQRATTKTYRRIGPTTCTKCIKQCDVFAKLSNGKKKQEFKNTSLTSHNCGDI